MIDRISTPRQRVEDDDFVEPVQELRTEVRPQRVHDLALDVLVERRRRTVALQRLFRDVVAADVRRHDHDRVLEVDRAALPVRQPPVVEQLQHDVEHLRMRLLDLVEQDDRVGAPADGFGQLSGLLVADVSGRRADQPRHGVLLLVLGHVDPDHRLLVVEQEFGERAGELGLADAGRAEEHEAAERPIRILEPGACAAHGVRDRRDRFVLPDDAGVQPLFHLEQLLDFAFHQPADRDVGPAADDFRDVFLVDFLLEHPAGLLHLGEPRLLVLESALELGQPAVLQLGRLRVISRLLRALHLQPHVLELLLELCGPPGSLPSPAASGSPAGSSPP